MPRSANALLGCPQAYASYLSAAVAVARGFGIRHARDSNRLSSVRSHVAYLIPRSGKAQVGLATKGETQGGKFHPEIHTFV